MDVNDYCRSVEIELQAWKAKMYDMVRNIDKLRAADKEKMSLEAEELHKNITEMEDIIQQLQTECPVDFSAQKKKVDETQAEVKKRYEDAMAAILQF